MPSRSLHASVLLVAATFVARVGAEAPPPVALRATLATRAEVALSWTGGDGQTELVVERKPVGASWTPPPAPQPSPIVTINATGTTARDAAIDPFVTYVYRVRAAASSGAPSAPSNEITVGPPPLGFSQIAPTLPGLRDADQFARAFVMTLDANGDPALAFLVTDPDNDGDPVDSALHFVGWDRAAYKWRAPVKVATIGVSDWNLRAGISLSVDATTNRYALAHPVGDHQINVAFSDDGVAWKDAVVQKVGDDATLGGARVVLSRGQVYFAYDEAGEDGKRGLTFRTGAQSDPPEKWSRMRAPVLAGGWDLRRAAVSIALDAAGKPGLVYWLGPEEGYNAQLAFWRPGEGAVKVMDSAGFQSDSSDAQLVFHGSAASVVAYVRRDEGFFQNVHQVWVVQSADNGATWGAPEPLPNDGGNSMGPPVEIAATSAGRVAITAWADGGNNSGTKCGEPKLIQRAANKAWTICSADSAKGTPTTDALYPTLAFAGNGKLYLAFRTAHEAAGLKPGLLLWRER